MLILLIGKVEQIIPKLAFCADAKSLKRGDILKSLKSIPVQHRLWATFISNHDYAKGDIFRTSTTPSWGYWEVTQSGTSTTDIPVGATEGMTYTSGTMKCKLIKIFNIDSASLIPMWEANKYYYVNNHVDYNDVIYRCIVENNDEVFTRDKWKVVGGYGNAEIKDWVSGATYSVGNVVWHDSKLVRCTADNNDTVFDSNKWVEMSTKYSFFEYNANGNLTIRRDLVYDEFFEVNQSGNIVLKI